MILLWFSMQGEDIIEHTMGKSHVFTMYLSFQEDDIL